MKPIPEDINDLKEKIKEKKPNDLNGTDADRLNVYAAGTSYPIVEGQDILDPGDAVPSKTTSKTPLIVVAPAIVLVSVVSDNHDTVGMAFVEPSH